MKTNKYTKVLAAAAIVLAASACDENSWNDKLDGFDKIENESVTDVQTVEYTLTDADYKTIAGLAENTALAGEDGKAALQQVGSMRRFSQAAPASKYVRIPGQQLFPLLHPHRRLRHPPHIPPGRRRTGGIHRRDKPADLQGKPGAVRERRMAV